MNYGFINFEMILLIKLIFWRETVKTAATQFEQEKSSLDQKLINIEASHASVTEKLSKSKLSYNKPVYS